ncbi:iron-containing alcohol dehydrogenase [Blautia sp. MSJ-19]|nr:iron-containing alcohol dehydrogenase [Blautia sp. MSJ-19]
MYQNFEYYTPTKVIFGKNTESQTGELVKAQNCKKALIHYGGKSAIRSGLLDRIKNSLDAVGGGSVIDSAKAIGYGVANEGDVWDFFEGKRDAKFAIMDPELTMTL